ncbi:MAG: YggT family protein [Gammaproteobacteria bacterium]|uniref:YggT family protein n=1 Tax=OM182 bacterium MED-G24 TaxID=1986255 RepID=A0A2A5X049_9GAMM|nr:YggT family protein [Gammaproteobacteria bacterium]PDH42185.1 MAG: YggT family protein [OM182 bacterium MED-G24]RPG23207.1 MAG: YggT family protein [Gammaproteobacteria bacterium TMED50]|tara:strand:+ start:167 stop:757 length:591 start_codon:yes stop_codon:yes gene_type:complete
MADSFADSGVYIVKVIFGLYGLLVMVRFLMQIARVDFYNPICQGIVQITEPALKPLAMLFPTIRGVNLATLVLAFLITLASLMLISMLIGYSAFQPFFLAWVALALFGQILDIYFWALLIMVISSWIAPHSGHPALNLVQQLTEPLCTPARKLLPPMGGLDLSIILVFLAITVTERIVIIGLMQTLGIPPGFVMGL